MDRVKEHVFWLSFIAAGLLGIRLCNAADIAQAYEKELKKLQFSAVNRLEQELARQANTQHVQTSEGSAGSAREKATLSNAVTPSSVATQTPAANADNPREKWSKPNPWQLPKTATSTPQETNTPTPQATTPSSQQLERPNIFKTKYYYNHATGHLSSAEIGMK